MNWFTSAGSNMLLGVLAAFLLLLIFYVLLLNYKMNRLTKKYHQYMKGEEGISLERKLSVEVKELREMTGRISSMVAEQEELSRLQNSALQNVGLVQYNAFPDSGQQESFSLTLLDGKGSGFTLTSLTNRNESRLYTKIVREGKYLGRASMEEEQSLEQALRRAFIQEQKGK